MMRAESLNRTDLADELGPALGNISHMAEKSARLRVLVVDDEPLIRWSLHETLADCGHDVFDAGDGQTAIRASRTLPPFDVILLDFRLPDSNDLTLLTTLHRIAPRSQIILMTAFGTAELFKDAIDRGAFSVVNKPFEVTALAGLVLQAHGAARPGH